MRSTRIALAISIASLVLLTTACGARSDAAIAMNGAGNTGTDGARAAEPSAFANLEAAQNLCTAASLAADELMRRSRAFSEGRRALSAEQLLELRRETILASNVEGYAACLVSGNDAELCWAGSMVMVAEALKDMRAICAEFDERFVGPDAAASQAGRAIESLRTMIALITRQVAADRLVPIAGGFQIIASDGTPDHAILPRDGCWYVAPTSLGLADVVECFKVGVQSVCYAKLLRAAVHEASSLDELDQRLAQNQRRIAVDIAAFEAQAVAQSGGGAAFVCPQCGQGGFFGGRCSICGLDLAGRPGSGFGR